MPNIVGQDVNFLPRPAQQSDITKLKSTHINPALASHAELKADIGLSV